MGVLDTLTPREKKVLSLRFGLEDGRQRTSKRLAGVQRDARTHPPDRGQGAAQAPPSEPEQEAQGLSGVNKVSKGARKRSFLIAVHSHEIVS